MPKRIPMLERLMARTKVTDECWLWQGPVTCSGYGCFTYKIGLKTTCRMAHRIMYETLVGPIPEGLTLDHLCLNKLCVNPTHLEPVTIGENIRRAPRSVSETCKYGHQYKDQSEHYKNKGARRCHECHAIAEAKRRIAV